VITQQNRKTNTRLSALPLTLLALGSSPTIAASVNSAGSADSWDLIIWLVVFTATTGSAVLNIAAIRNWDRNWGLVSGLPLLGLLLWGTLILVAKQLDASTHELWALEIFAWAMINLIYMVTAMTAKRMFAKRDGEEPANS
jgi:hypothetical protein